MKQCNLKMCKSQCVYTFSVVLFYNAASTVVVRRLVNEELVLRWHVPRGTAEDHKTSVTASVVSADWDSNHVPLARLRYTNMLRHVKVQHSALNSNKKARFSPVCILLLSELAPLRVLLFLPLTLNNVKWNFTQLTSQTWPVTYKPFYDS